MQPLAVDASGVSKRYGDREVLSNVDLIVQPGTLHGLLGPNGAGKTTLMRVLLGLVHRNHGRVQLLGHDLDSGSHLPDGIAAVVETSAFYPYLTGRQNLSVLARLDAGRARTRRVTVASALEDVGLTLHADAYVRTYSAGMRQRLGLAAARLRAPDLLFLDEPTSSLDPRSARQVRALVQQMADEGTAVVLSSHDMTEVEELCRTLTVLHGGHVVFSGAVDDLRSLTPATIVELHTSNNSYAIRLSCDHRRLRLLSAENGLELLGDTAAVDAFVIALGHAGIAVRSLTRRVRSLESLFLELTNRLPPAGHNAAAPLHDRLDAERTLTATS